MFGIDPRWFDWINHPETAKNQRSIGWPLMIMLLIGLVAAIRLVTGQLPLAVDGDISALLTSGL